MVKQGNTVRLQKLDKLSPSSISSRLNGQTSLELISSNKNIANFNSLTD